MPDGTPFIGASYNLDTSGGVPRRYDPEGIRLLRNAHVLISDQDGPRVDEAPIQRRSVKAWHVPDMFKCAVPGMSEAAELPPVNRSGRQPNRGFEGLAVTPSGRAVAMLQSPLIQDAGLTAKNKRSGLNVRLVEVKEVGNGPQWVYQLGFPGNGISEVLALNETDFLTIERDGKDGKFRRVFLFTTRGATDVSGVAGLPLGGLDSSILPVQKRLLINMLEPGFHPPTTPMPEKIEGLAFGPNLPDGRRLLIITSDNDMKADEETLVWYVAIEPGVLLAPFSTPRAADRKK